GESCRHADFSQAFSREDVVSFVEHEEVLELLARSRCVLALEQHGLEKEEAEESLLIVAEALEFEHNAAREERRHRHAVCCVQRASEAALRQLLQTTRR